MRGSQIHISLPALHTQILVAIILGEERDIGNTWAIQNRSGERESPWNIPWRK